MAVECAFTEPREVFTAANYTGIVKTTKECTSVTDRLFRAIGYRSRTEDFLRGCEAQIQAWGKIGVEPQGANLIADQPTVFAKEFGRTGRTYVRNRRNRSNHVAQAIDRATFHVDAQEHGSGDRPLCMPEKLVYLRCLFDVALEQDYAAGIQRPERRAQPRRDVGAIEAHNEQLADLLSKIESISRRHLGYLSGRIRSVPRTRGPSYTWRVLEGIG